MNFADGGSTGGRLSSGSVGPEAVASAFTSDIKIHSAGRWQRLDTGQSHPVSREER
jgi:hypothetical protein